MLARMRALLQQPEIIQARTWLEMNDGRTLATQRALARIPAPSGAEGARGAEVEARMRAIGLAAVRTDAVGNVLGRTGPGEGPGLVIAAHLDTVFAADIPHEVTIAGPRLIGPGIGDNARGLAALLTLAEACVVCRLSVPRPVTFVATVGEEGAGDLRGVKHLFADPAFRPDAFVALDGPGLDRLVHRAVGSRRFRTTFRGPGGHSWAAFGVANPAHAACQAAAQAAALPLPASPRATLSVVRLGGGTGLNTIPSEAWFDVDLRAEADAALEQLEADAVRAAEEARDRENRRRAPGTASLTVDVTSFGRRPSGLTPAEHPLVAAALAATRALGGEAELASASTDANLPMSLGIPSITLGAGGKGGDAHLATEWYENAGGTTGILRALLVMMVG